MTAFPALASRVVADVLALSPEAATVAGEHAHDDRLTDLSADGLAHARLVLAGHREALATVDPAGLSPDDRVDRAVLADVLDRRLHELAVVRAHAYDPRVYDPGEALFPLLTRDALPAADRLRALAGRLAAVPERLAQARAGLEEPGLVQTETALGQVAGTTGLVRDDVPALLAQEPSLRPLVEPARDAALTALEEHRGWLAGLLADGRATTEPRLTADVFAERLRLVLHSALTPDEVVARAHAHLADTTERLHEAARALLPDARGTRAEVVRAALDAVAADAPDDTTIVPRAEAALAEVTEVTRRLGFVTVPDDPIRIEVMPEFRRGVAVAYCDAPPPLETGGETVYAIAPTPAEWPAERRASFYREYNAALLVSLGAHEGVPGHALQLAHARRAADRLSSPVRVLFRSGSFVEGWAVHAERLVVESGHGGLPVRLQQLKMQLRLTINALLDAGVHGGGMTREEGLALMTGRGFQEEGEAVGKWRRALLTSGQLSTYFVGYAELADLFRSLGERPGQPLASYDPVLAHGSPPPGLLGDLLGVDR